MKKHQQADPSSLLMWERDGFRSTGFDQEVRQPGGKDGRTQQGQDSCDDAVRRALPEDHHANACNGQGDEDDDGFG